MLMQLSILGTVWACAIWWILRFLRWTTYLPVPGRRQNVVAIARRGVRLDVRQALARVRR